MGNEYIFPSSLMPSSMPPPGIFKAFVSGRERFGQEAAFFNSELTPKTGFKGNASLTIYLRLFLRPWDEVTRMAPLPVLDNGKVVEVVPWGMPVDDGVAYDFAEFRRKVKEQAEKYWDGTNFCLQPPKDYRGLEYVEGTQKVRPNIDCRFRIVWADGVSDAHAVIDCICPKKARDFRPNVRPTETGALGGQWTCYDLDNRPNGRFIKDGKECKDFVGDPLGQMEFKTFRCNKELAREAVCHEIGHLLGLSHVGNFFKTPECLAAITPTDTNPDACYVGPTDNDTENIMGCGDKTALWNIMPIPARNTFWPASSAAQ